MSQSRIVDKLISSNVLGKVFFSQDLYVLRVTLSISANCCWVYPFSFLFFLKFLVNTFIISSYSVIGILLLIFNLFSSDNK